MTIQDLVDAMTKCPVCGAEVNIIQECREYVQIYLDTDLDTDEELHGDLDVLVSDIFINDGDIIETCDVEFQSIVCDDSGCCATWTSKESFKAEVLEKFKEQLRDESTNI